MPLVLGTLKSGLERDWLVAGGGPYPAGQAFGPGAASAPGV